MNLVAALGARRIVIGCVVLGLAIFVVGLGVRGASSPRHQAAAPTHAAAPPGGAQATPDPAQAQLVAAAWGRTYFANQGVTTTAVVADPEGENAYGQWGFMLVAQPGGQTVEVFLIPAAASWQVAQVDP